MNDQRALKDAGSIPGKATLITINAALSFLCSVLLLSFASSLAIKVCTSAIIRLDSVGVCVNELLLGSTPVPEGKPASLRTCLDRDLGEKRHPLESNRGSYYSCDWARAATSLGENLGRPKGALVDSEELPLESGGAVYGPANNRQVPGSIPARPNIPLASPPVSPAFLKAARSLSPSLLAASSLLYNLKKGGAKQIFLQKFSFSPCNAENFPMKTAGFAKISRATKFPLPRGYFDREFCSFNSSWDTFSGESTKNLARACKMLKNSLSPEVVI